MPKIFLVAAGCADHVLLLICYHTLLLLVMGARENKTHDSQSRQRQRTATKYIPATALEIQTPTKASRIFYKINKNETIIDCCISHADRKEIPTFTQGMTINTEYRHAHRAPGEQSKYLIRLFRVRMRYWRLTSEHKVCLPP